MKDSVLTMVSGAQSAGWTDERVETLKKLWMEGLSASQIAGELGEGVCQSAPVAARIFSVCRAGATDPVTECIRAKA